MPSAAQVHIAVVHLPVVLVWICPLLLAVGLIGRRPDVIRVGLACAIAAGICALPTYLSGDSADGEVEMLPGVEEARIEAHEEMAGAGAGILGALGLIALGAYLEGSRSDFARKSTLLRLTILVVPFAAVVLGYVSHLGGAIRRPEISSSARPIDAPPPVRSFGAGD